MSEPSPIVKALTDVLRSCEAAGLERLIEHYQLHRELNAGLEKLGCVYDLRDPLIATLAWTLVGPKLAQNSSVFLGRRAGAPRKTETNSIDTIRADCIDKVRQAVRISGYEVSDAEIIQKAKEGQNPLFQKASIEALKNSVSRGRRKLKDLQKR